MDEEIQPAAWRKAIPMSRDRWQSRVLAWVIGPLLVVLLALNTWIMYPRWEAPAWVFSIAFALLVWRLRAATAPAAFLGGVVCMNILLMQDTGMWQHTALPALLTLFVLTFSATRFGRRRKEALGTAEPRPGRRAAQIVANLGIAGLCAGHVSAAAFAACIAALAEATADTVSSEMGQVLAGSTWMITTRQKVPPGTDGGVSLAGTALGLFAAGIVVAVTALSRPLTFQSALVILAAAVAGLLFDSVLGATLERRGWIGNDWVNFASTLFAAGLAYRLAKLAEPAIAK
jgi:uncharacterized protein (TIGR00297 family)